MTTINEKTLFENGMLVNINLGSWQARNKLKKEDLEGFTEEEKKLVRGVFDLLADKSLLDDIVTFDNKIRNHIKSVTIPFPIDGIYFVLGNKIEYLLKYIEEKKIERMELVNKFVEEYENLIQDFKANFPKFYDRAVAKGKYPSKQDLINRYYFKFNFFQISIPDKKLEFISPALYKEEMSKFKDQIEMMKKEVVNIIYTELLELVNRLKNQSTSGKPSQRTLNTLNSFMERIDETYSDFLERKDMRSIIEKIRKIAGNISADDLRNDDKFRSEFGGKMKTLLKDISSLPDVEAKRAIEL